MTIFQVGHFVSASGIPLEWKIECDALSYDDWQTLAFLGSQLVGRFSEVAGVPRGGLPFAAALEPYKGKGGPRLVVDDVLTTGGSLAAMRRSGDIGLVAFARGPLPSGVAAVFQLGSPLDMNPDIVANHDPDALG